MLAQRRVGLLDNERVQVWVLGQRQFGGPHRPGLVRQGLAGPMPRQPPFGRARGDAVGANDLRPGYAGINRGHSPLTEVGAIAGAHPGIFSVRQDSCTPLSGAAAPVSPSTVTCPSTDQLLRVNGKVP